MSPKQKPSSKVSLGDVAAAAGISKAAAGYALQNKPGVSKATRERVVRLAKKMGYTPDARIASWMTAVRNTREKGLLSLAWINLHSEKEAWSKYLFLTPYMEGARERALQLGYRIEEIWAHEPGMTMRRVSRIIDQRGIEGVILTQFRSHFRLNWERFASVSLEGPLFMPGLDRIMSDFLFNFLLALKTLKRAGYRRIGVCLDSKIDSSLYSLIDAKILQLNASIPAPARVPPLFYKQVLPGESWQPVRKQIAAWCRRYKPDVVVGHNADLVNIIRTAGYRVPEEIGVVHLAIDDDVADWAGIYSNRRITGAAAVEKLVSMIRNRQFGLPKVATNVLVRGSWSPGRTLLIPKPGGISVN